MLLADALDAQFRQAAAALSAGQIQAAAAMCKQILAAAPLHPGATHLLGMAMAQLGDRAAAIELLRRASQLKPNDPEVLLHLAMTLMSSNESAAALQAVTRAVQIAPNNVRVLFNLGNIQLLSGQAAAAIQTFQRALPLAPDDPKILNNLANALTTEQRHREAVEIYRKALATQPTNAGLLNNLGSALLAAGDAAAAIEPLQRAVTLDPKSAVAFRNLSQAFTQLDRDADALPPAQQAVALSPGTAEYHQHLGNVLARLERVREAADEFRKVLAANPNSAEAWNNLGVVLKDLGDGDGALDAYTRTVELAPNLPIAVANLAGLRRETGEIELAVEGCRQAVAMQPDSPRMLSNLILFLHFCPGDHSAELRELYQRFNKRFIAPLPKLRHVNSREPNRKLRIGYLSPDFHQTAGGWFLWPLLEQHDKSQFEIFCYYNHTKVDDWTARLRAHADHWRVIADVSDEAAAQLIRDDGIDILLDLAMHTPRGRMMVFAHKPAPVQVTYLAYVGTTGLSTMNYRLTDPLLDPQGVKNEYSEESVWLKSYWCYPAPEIAPAVTPAPSEQNGYVTFGSFNSAAKVSTEVLDVWARILNNVAGSRLLMHSSTGRHREKIRARFESHGIAGDRIDFFPMLKVAKYYGQIGTVDIALDPFPYAGGTTTCDTLWMGVPVVTLAYPEAHGRGGVSILTHLNLEDLIARDTDEYVRIAMTLAGNGERRRKLRATFRERMLSSVLMDRPAYARDMEAAYRQMWQAWCAKGT